MQSLHSYLPISMPLYLPLSPSVLALLTLHKPLASLMFHEPASLFLAPCFALLSLFS
jgi:hypothetical protein